MSGSNKIAITISAIDNTSARLEAINKKIAGLTAPITRLNKSFSRFSDASGVTKLTKGFNDLGRSAFGTFQNLSRVVEPLGVITGAASLAGIVRLTTAWSQWGSQLGFTARRLGISAGTLQSFQGAARLAGSSAASLSSGMQTLGQNMWNAVGGRSPETIATFRYLGLSFQNVNGSAKSVSTMLPLIADKIKAIKNPFAQAAVATALFGGAGQDLLPFLREGSKGIAHYNAMMKRYGLTTNLGVTAANNLRVAQVGLSLAVQSLGNSVADRLSPVLTPVLNKMSDWVVSNRAWISTGITQAVGKFATWLQSVNWVQVGAGISSVAHGIGSVVRYLGGWGDAARDLAIFWGVKWAASMLAPIVTITAAMANLIGLQRAASLGFSPAALGAGAMAAGAGAALAGSYYDATHPAQFRNMYIQRDARISAWGKAQLAPDIQARIVADARSRGIDPRFMIALARQEAGGYDNVSSAGARGPMQLMPGTAKDMGVQNIDNWKQNVDGGVKYFSQLLKQFHGNYNAAAAAYNAGAHGRGVINFANTNDASGMPNQTQNYVASIDALYPTSGPGLDKAPHVVVDVNHNNAPAGTSVAVKSTGPGASVGAIKVVKAMPGGSL